MKTREEINKEYDDFDKACKSIDMEKFHELCLKTGKNEFTHEELMKLGCSADNKIIPKSINANKSYSHKDVKKILLMFKHNFESNADGSSHDGIIKTIHDPKCGCRAIWTQKDLKRRLLNLKHCLEIICDYYCSDSIIDKYLK
jgi:hypothetical protein